MQRNTIPPTHQAEPSLAQRFWQDQHGLVLSAELIIIVTLVVIGLITGLACLQQAVVAELQDVGWAIQGMNQSYGTSGFRGCRKWFGFSSWTAGSRFIDVRSQGMMGAQPVCDIGVGVAGGYAGGATAAPGNSRSLIIENQSPAGTHCVDCPQTSVGPALPPADCVECGPERNSTGHALRPQPEIPLGPVPQILPQW